MIHVLRLGHRRRRDPRLTTHVCLTARAFGADAVLVAEEDAELAASIGDVVDRFGGPFEVRTGVPWRRTLEQWQDAGGLVIHLTMYGVPLDEAVTAEVRARDVMLVVGSEKVPGDLYRLADLNVAAGNQPHSEVAALALALDRLTDGAWAAKRFDGRVRIEPNPEGKTIIEN